MATKIGDLFFDVYADTSRAARNVEDLSGKMQAAGSAAARAIGDTIANSLALVTGATIALGVQTINLGVHYNTLGQSATAAFSSIYDDVSAANDILQQISQLDLETPFKGSALTATARTLAGFGFGLEDVVDTTQALAQATAAMGLGSDALHRMAIAFGQIQSRGKLAGDEARQLANYGVDVYGLLADKLGLTVAQVRELGQQSKLTSDFVIPALVESINERFAGATEALFATAAGQAEGLRSIFEGIGSAIVEPFIGFSSGGALVDAMDTIRTSLLDLVSVAEDGSFRLQGFLAPLEPILAGLADDLRGIGTAIADFIDGIDDDALVDLFDTLDGLGPLLGAVGAGLITVFAQAIPFLGRFVAGFNPIVVGLTVLLASSSEVRDSLVDAFKRIWDAVQPLIPSVSELVAQLTAIAEQVVPIVLETLANAFEELVPVVQEAIDWLNGLLPVIGPVLVEVVQAAADALNILLDIIGFLPPEVIALTAALYGLTRVFPLITLGIVANASITAAVEGVSMLHLGLTRLVPAIAAATAAWGAFQGVRAGLTGDTDWLDREVTLFEKPFQAGGRAGFSIGQSLSGNGIVDQFMQQVAEAAQMGFDAAENFDTALLGQVDTFAEAREAALEYATSLGLVGQAANNFASTVALAWRDQQNVLIAAVATLDIINRVIDDFARANPDALINGIPVGLLGESVDLMRELEKASRAAWEEVSRLTMIGPDATVDDFLRELPGLARDVSDAMAETGPAIIRNLDVEGALQDVNQAARAVVQRLAQDYGLSMSQIRDHLSGVADVTAVLTQITEETTQSLDPLIAKYMQLGATAEQVRTAIGRLNDQRTTAIRAQIDQVQAALRDAKEAAQEARDAVEDFISGGYLTGPQALIDDLITRVGSIGSAVEEGLQVGGVRGEAMIRSAFGDAQGQIAKIVMAGLESGMSGADIVRALQPVLTAINEEIGDARNRISSLDWTEGFTANAGGMLVQALQRGLDPGAIQGLISNILGADRTVTGLENKLENLQAALNADVEFSVEQVQAELNRMSAETQMTVSRAVISPEAAQAVYDEIMKVLNDDPLAAAIDKAVITDQILDAAKDAENEIELVFRSGLSFDSAELTAIARQVSDEFYTAFVGQLDAKRDEQAKKAGFDSYSQMVSALGPAVASATIGATTITTNINQDIKVDGAQTPQAVGTEIVAAGSAAAGSGGAYDPSKYNRLRVR